MKTLFLLSVITLSACSTVIKTPITRFESPEVVGDTLGAQFHGGWQGVAETTIAEDWVYRPANVNTPRIESGYRPVFGAGLGFFQFLELQLRAPSFLQAKFQVLGDPAKKAKAGNFSFAWTAGYGSSRESSSSTTLFTNESRAIDLKEQIYDASAILGWRAADDFLIYSSVFGNWNRITGYQVINGNNNGFDAWHRTRGVNLGVEARAKNLFLRAEGGAAEVKLNQSRSTEATGGVLVGAWL